MDGGDQDRAVIGALVAIFADRLGHLLLEHLHHLRNGRRGDEVEDDVERLLADVEVGRGEGPEDIHDELGDHLRVLLLQILQALQHDQLDIVIGLR